MFFLQTFYVNFFVWFGTVGHNKPNIRFVRNITQRVWRSGTKLLLMWLCHGGLWAQSLCLHLCGRLVSIWEAKSCVSSLHGAWVYICGAADIRCTCLASAHRSQRGMYASISWIQHSYREINKNSWLVRKRKVNNKNTLYLPTSINWQNNDLIHLNKSHLPLFLVISPPQQNLTIHVKTFCYTTNWRNAYS